MCVVGVISIESIASGELETGRDHGRELARIPLFKRSLRRTHSTAYTGRKETQSNRARGRKGQQATKMNPPPPPPFVAAPPAAAPAGSGGGGRAAADNRCCWWYPVVSRRALTRAQVGMAAAAAAFALFAATLKPATFPHLPPQCVATPADTMDLRYHAAVLLLYAMAQGGAATASLILVPPSVIGWVLACSANLLGVVTLIHLVQVVPKALFLTGGLCSRGTAELLIPTIFAGTFLFAAPFLWIISPPQNPNRRMN